MEFIHIPRAVQMKEVVICEESLQLHVTPNELKTLRHAMGAYIANHEMRSNTSFAYPLFESIRKANRHINGED